MLEFLKNYWTLIVCAILIITVVVLLIVFRDKPDTKDANETKDEANNQES